MVQSWTTRAALRLLVFACAGAIIPPADSTRNWDATLTSNPHVYWINMEGNKLRRDYTENQLKSYGLSSHRVEAVTATSSTFNVTLLHKPCKRNTDKDIAVILSHLTAIHRAIYDDQEVMINGNNSSSRSSSSNQRRKHRSTKRPHLSEEHPAESINPSDYALILEDDVKFLFHLNFTSLILSAPKDFGILQLSTSNEEAIESLWSAFNKKSTANKAALTAFTELKPTLKPNSKSDVSGLSGPDKVKWGEWQGLVREFELNQSRHSLWSPNLWTSTTKNGKEALYWSAQAYLINKKRIKLFIDDVAAVDSEGKLSFKIVNSFNPKGCKRTKRYPCILSNCLFSDTYIYAGGGPTYVSNLPLFTGASIGLQSEVHQEQVSVHIKGFERIDRIGQSIREGISTSKFFENYSTNFSAMSNSLLLPPFILNPQTCSPPFGS